MRCIVSKKVKASKKWKEKRFGCLVVTQKRRGYIITEARTGQVVIELNPKIPKQVLGPLLKIIGRILKPCAKLLALGKAEPGVREAAKLVMSLVQPWREALEVLSRAYASL